MVGGGLVAQQQNCEDQGVIRSIVFEIKTLMDYSGDMIDKSRSDGRGLTPPSPKFRQTSPKSEDNLSFFAANFKIINSDVFYEILRSYGGIIFVSIQRRRLKRGIENIADYWPLAVWPPLSTYLNPLDSHS
jgi:hypothetical protein